MISLTDFLLARIADDEAAARAVPPLDHNFDMGGARQDERFTFGRTLPSSADGMGNWSKHRDDLSTAAHFLRHDPARVLAECEAKRRIVEEWLTFKKVSDERADDTPLPQALTQAGIVVGLERAARALALPYADHPDYREEWKP